MQQQMASVPLKPITVAPMHAIDYAGLNTELVKCSLMLPLNVVNREVLGEAHACMCKNRSQAMGASAAACVQHKEIFSLPPTCIARIYAVNGGLLPASINGIQEHDLIGTGALRNGLISQNPQGL